MGRAIVWNQVRSGRLRYNFRLYRTVGSGRSRRRRSGCARVVFNDALRVRQWAREAGLACLSDGAVDTVDRGEENSGDGLGCRNYRRLFYNEL
ncbi:helix-turn-helix domain-containing protein [Nocardia sp. NBC_01730]|uniref:helix-turn-helix domain-containing protein n=1 Tax=Nocardia sp. NBC_01730 TaxID=2975998 RepID=UPI003FA3BE37